jgi:uncharacterized protein YndB with AHSA1/START domain
MLDRDVYLEVVPNERLVFTDAFVRVWEPSQQPFFPCIMTFEDEAGKTRYTAHARIGPWRPASGARPWASNRAGARRRPAGGLGEELVGRSAREA